MASSVQNVTSGTTNATSSSLKTVSRNTMDKDVFMKMLIAQLQNQDPLNPMDGTQFASQLAQFSQLEQLQNLNTSMSSLPTYLNSFANAQMVGMIGNEATAKGNVINVNSSTAKISYKLPQDIASAKIKIYNPNGSLINTLNVGSQSAGINSVTWNCGSVSHGNYTFEVSAMDKSGNAVTANTLITGTVTGTSFKDSAAYLTINGQEVAFSDVIAVNKANN